MLVIGFKSVSGYFENYRNRKHGKLFPDLLFINIFVIKKDMTTVELNLWYIIIIEFENKNTDKKFCRITMRLNGLKLVIYTKQDHISGLSIEAAN